MTSDEFAALADFSIDALTEVVDADWTTRAGVLEWSCWRTVDHMVDCLFSYAMQIGARAQSGYLPFEELHAKREATPPDLVAGLRSVTALLVAVVRDSPGTVTASDGVLELNLSDWCARAAYELVLHTHDVMRGLGRDLDPPLELCRMILESDALWMLNREQANEGSNSWAALLLGSGRPEILPELDQQPNCPRALAAGKVATALSPKS
jgi:hypothetical protein